MWNGEYQQTKEKSKVQCWSQAVCYAYNQEPTTMNIYFPFHLRQQHTYNFLQCVLYAFFLYYERGFDSSIFPINICLKTLYFHCVCIWDGKNNMKIFDANKKKNRNQ